MKYLITGGAGFIGSHLVEYLISQNHQIIVLDNLSTSKISNLNRVKSLANLVFVKGTTLDRRLVKKLVNQVDQIFHLAATVGVELAVKEPILTIENNVFGTKHVLEAAANKNQPVFVTSSSEVYGKNTQRYFSERADLTLGQPKVTRWGYACSKMLDEHLALGYWHKNKLPVVIGRLFNTVGERQSARYGMVIPRFINQAINNQDLTIYGDGHQVRSFCYVKDVVWAMVKLMSTKKAFGEIFNIGSNQSITITKLADKVIKITGSQSQKRYIPFTQIFGDSFEETEYRRPDLRKINRFIGFKSQTTLDKIIRLVLKDIKTKYNS